jgi:hypothetical protein
MTKPRERQSGVPTRRKDVHLEIAKPKRKQAVDETTYSRNKMGIAVDSRGRFIGRRDIEKGAAHFWDSRRSKNT